MSNILTITPQQCKRARALLKWNPQDLASRTHVSVRQIEKFERNQTKLLKPENAEIVEAFEKKGLHFLKNGDVKQKHATHSSDGTNALGDNEETRINLDALLISAEKTTTEADFTDPARQKQQKSATS